MAAHSSILTRRIPSVVHGVTRVGCDLVTKPPSKTWSLMFKGIVRISLMQEWGFPGGSVVKNLFAKKEMQVSSLGWAGPLEKEVASHSVILPGKPHAHRSLVCSSWGRKGSDTRVVTKQQQFQLKYEYHCLFKYSLNKKRFLHPVNCDLLDRFQKVCFPQVFVFFWKLFLNRAYWCRLL